MGSFQLLRWSKYVCITVHGRNLVGDKGAVSPSLFYTGGDIICHVPPLFSLRVFVGGVSKLNATFVTFCVKSFSC